MMMLTYKKTVLWFLTYIFTLFKDKKLTPLALLILSVLMLKTLDLLLSVGVARWTKLWQELVSVQSWMVNMNSLGLKGTFKYSLLSDISGFNDSGVSMLD